MKKTKQTVLCFLLIFGLMLMTACGSTNNNSTDGSTKSTTMAATESAGGTGTGPTNNSQSGTDSMESTGVLDGIGQDIKDGAEDIKDGAEDMLDGTSSHDGAASHPSTGA